MDVKIKEGIKILIVLGVIAFIIFILPDLGKDDGPSQYEQYENKYQEQKYQEELQSEYRYWNDECAYWEDLVDFPNDYEQASEFRVTGEVASIDNPNEPGNPIFIDLGESYPSKHRVTIVIWTDDFDNIGIKTINNTVNKINIGDTIYVEGRYEMYNGIPQIVVEWSDGIYIPPNDLNL